MIQTDAAAEWTWIPTVLSEPKETYRTAKASQPILLHSEGRLYHHLIEDLWGDINFERDLWEDANQLKMIDCLFDLRRRSEEVSTAAFLGHYCVVRGALDVKGFPTDVKGFPTADPASSSFTAHSVSDDVVKDAVQSFNESATQNQPFDECTASKFVEAYFEKHINGGTVLEEAKNPENHGRTRWFLLDLLARTPDSELSQYALSEFESTSDPWLLLATAIILRNSLTDSDFKSRVRDSILRKLNEIHQNSNEYRGVAWSSGIGECIKTLAVYSSVSDLDLLYDFASGNWDLTPCVNASNALSVISRANPEANITTQFFNKHSEKLESTVKVWAMSWRSSKDIVVLLLAWIDLLLSRLGPEGSIAVELAKEHSMLVRPVRQKIRSNWTSLSDRGLDSWLQQRKESVDSWKDDLNKAVST